VRCWWIGQAVEAGLRRQVLSGLAILALVGCEATVTAPEVPQLGYAFADLGLEPEFTCREDLPEGRPVYPERGGLQRFFVGQLSAPIGTSSAVMLYYVQYTATGCRIYYPDSFAPPSQEYYPAGPSGPDRLLLARFETAALRRRVYELLSPEVFECREYAFFRTGHLEGIKNEDRTCIESLADELANLGVIIILSGYSDLAGLDVPFSLLIRDEVFLVQRFIPYPPLEIQ
jgi:hypothetical protein